MKLTKRITSLLLTFVFVFTSICTFAQTDITFSDVNEQNMHYEAITSLVSKGIINGYEDGSFKPDNTITRAEFSKLLAVASAPKGYAFTATATQFPDIANANADHGWAIPYIAYAVSTKAINGYDDGTFRAGNPVTYGEAIKMIVCTLGYGPVADLSLTPWYQGYINIANQIGLSKNAMSAGDAPASRSIVAHLIYNMLDCPVLTQTGVDDKGNPIYSTSGNQSFGDEINNQESSEGVVLGVTDFSLDGSSVLRNRILIDDVSYIVGGNYDVESLKSYVGQRVEFSYTGIDSRLELTSISRATGYNNEFTIEPWQIAQINAANNNILYYATEQDEWSNITSRINLSSPLYVVYNGVPVNPSNINSTFISQYFNVETGSIRFISNDATDSTAEVVFIESYVTYFTSTPTQSTGVTTIYDKNTSYTSLSPMTINHSDAKNVTKVSSKGGTPSSSSLTAVIDKSVVSVAVPYGTTKGTNVIISSAYVSGDVKEMTEDYETIKIGNNYYELSPYYKTLLNANCPEAGFATGDNAKFYLDYLGRIVYSEKNETSNPYGLLIAYGSQGGFNSVNALKILTTGNKYLEYKMKDTFKINGNSMSSSEAINYLKLSCPTYNAGNPNFIIQPVRYQTSGTGADTIFTSLETIDKDDYTKGGIVPYEIKNDVNGTKLPYANGGKLKYSSSGYTFKDAAGGLQFNMATTGANATIVFTVPQNLADSSKYKKYGATYFNNTSEYVVEPYDVTGTSAKVVLCYLSSTPEPTSRIVPSTPVYLVESVTDATNGSEQIVKKLTYKKIASSETPEPIYSNEDEDVIAKLATVQSGDLIKFVTEEVVINDVKVNVISDVKTVYSSGALTTETGSLKNGNANHITKNSDTNIVDYYQVIRGTIYDLVEDANHISIIPTIVGEGTVSVDDVIIPPQMTSTTPFYKYNSTEGKFELSSSGSVKRYLKFETTDPSSASQAILVIMNNKVVGVYLLNE